MSPFIFLLIAATPFLLGVILPNFLGKPLRTKLIFIALSSLWLILLGPFTLIFFGASDHQIMIALLSFLCECIILSTIFGILQRKRRRRAQ